MRCPLILLSATFLLMASACKTPQPPPEPSDITGFGLLPQPTTDQIEAGAVPLQAPQPGRYLGNLMLPASSGAVRAVFDLALVDIGPKEIHYRAVLRLGLGSHVSHEYFATYYEKLIYEPSSRRLSVFDTGGDLTLSGVKFTSDWLEGTVRSAKALASGQMRLVRQKYLAQTVDDILGEQPVAVTPSVTGSYRGACGGVPATLELEMTKWRGQRPTDSLISGGYRVSGRLRPDDPSSCVGRTSCPEERYDGGAVDYFNGRLELVEEDGQKRCRFNDGVVACGMCSYKMADQGANTAVLTGGPYRMAPRNDGLPYVAGIHNPILMPKGQFYGYIHHEYRDLYQLMAFNLDEQGNDGEGVATLYFGEGDSNEFLVQRMAPRGEGSEAGGMLLDGEGDGFFVVTQASEDRVQGVWYSKAFGRVGTVVLTKDLVPSLAERKMLLRPLSGEYRTDKWEYQIHASAELSAGYDDFYPLKVYGWLKSTAPNGRRRQITEGVYDYFTGSIALRVNDGRIVTGAITKAGMDLFWPQERLGGPQGETHKLTYHGLGDDIDQTARQFGIPPALNN